MAIVRIQAAMIGFFLAVPSLAGRLTRDDSSAAGAQPNLAVSSPAPVTPGPDAFTPGGSEAQDGFNEPHVGQDPSASPSDSAREKAMNEVPTSDPLPTGPISGQARGAQSGDTEATPRPSQTGGVKGAVGAPGQQRPGQRPQNDRPQEIEFDPQGLITLHTNELDVRQLLELISRRSGMNILVSPKVQGAITANFEKIQVEDLVKSVLKLSNLVEKVEGDVHYIYSREDLKNEAEEKKKERILTKVYRLNYVRADELMVMITPFLSPDVGRKRFSTSANYIYGISEASTLATGGMGSTGGGAAGGGGAVAGAAPGGAGTIQRGTQPPTGGLSMSNNDMVVIQDYESNLKIIDQIIRRIDVRPVQVLIEAVIISVELSKDKELGVNFAIVDNLGQQLGTIGTGAAINGNVGFTPAQVLTAAGKIAASTPADPTGFASATNGIKYGFVSNNVTGFIRAIETLGSTKVLASPRILVLNKQRAEIQLGSRLGFRTLSQNYTSTIQQVQFLNTGTLLRLRPFVSTDGMVRMEIHPERSSGVVQDDLPSARTAELTTNVMVPDGATLVIGGLMEDEDIYQQQGLPGLSRMPLLGHVFGSKQKTDTRRELVVLLTPHIWSESVPDHGSAALAMRGNPGPLPELPRASTGTTNRVPPPVSASAFAAPTPAAGSPRREPTASPMPPALTGPRSGSFFPSTVPFPRPGSAPAVTSRNPGRSNATRESQPPNAIPPTKPPESRPINRSTLPGRQPEEDNTAGRPKLKLRRTTFQLDIQPVEHHRVAEGETLQSIARRYYGSSRFAPALWEANRAVVSSSKGLQPGIELTIPTVSELDQGIVKFIQASSRTRSTNGGEAEQPGTMADGDRFQQSTGQALSTSTEGAGPDPGTGVMTDGPGMQTAPSSSATAGLVEAPSRELLDTLESQPETRLSDVIDTSLTTSPEVPSSSSGAKIDPMVIHAGFEQSHRDGYSGPNPGDKSTLDRGFPLRRPTDTNTGIPDRTPTSADGSAPLALPEASDQPTLERTSLPDLEPTPALTPEAPGGATTPREFPGAFSGPRGDRTEGSGRPGSQSSLEDAAPPGHHESVRESDEGGYAVHVVQKFETLRTIARDRLGNPLRAGEIFELNRELFAEDAKPRPGMRLVLPARSKPSRTSR